MPTQHSIGHPFIALLTVDSTNNYAMGLVHAGMAQHGTAVFTNHQTNGRGQRGKTWLTGAGNNMALSVVIAPTFKSASEMFLLSMAVANAVRRFFNSYVPDEVTIKWPNDLYWQDRKAGGILIENLWQGTEWRFAIAGIGININQAVFDALDTKPVSLLQITGKKHDVTELAKELCLHLEASLEVLQQNRQQTIDEYGAHLYKHNQLVRLKKGSRVFEARVQGVSNSGELIVSHAAEERFAVGEVEWLI